MSLRRGRGLLLRLARQRLLAIALGVALAAPAAWAEFGGVSGIDDAWWVEGASLVAGATGIALIWTGLTGPRPDWVDGNTTETDD